MEYVQYEQIWQVLLVICSYAAFTYNILLVITLIVFFMKYQKTMLMAFITMNTRDSGIPSAKANSISRPFPPLFMIIIPKDEQIVKDLQEIKNMKLVVQVIMIIVCIIITFIVLYYCCKNCRHTHTMFKYFFSFLPISRILRMSHRTDLFVAGN